MSVTTEPATAERPTSAREHTSDHGSTDNPTFIVQGQYVTVPVEVRSAKMVQASWLVPATAAQKLIDYSGLRIHRMAKTLAMCSLAAVQYTDNDLGPYNEIAVAFVVEPHDDAPAGSAMSGDVTTFIHKLPVNQSFTCDAGRDIWGFPKWVADITFTERGRRTEAVLIDDGEFVLSLSVGRSPVPMPARAVEMSCYSHRDGVLRRTPWTNRVSDARISPAGARLELGTRHAMATELRALGLPRRPVMSMSVGRLGATFGPAEVVDARPT